MSENRLAAIRLERFGSEPVNVAALSPAQVKFYDWLLASELAARGMPRSCVSCEFFQAQPGGGGVCTNTAVDRAISPQLAHFEQAEKGVEGRRCEHWTGVVPF